MDPSPFLTLNNPPKYIVHMSKDDICLYTITIQMICFSPWELDRINCWCNNLSQKKYFSVQWEAKKKSRPVHHQMADLLLIAEERTHPKE